MKSFSLFFWSHIITGLVFALQDTALNRLTSLSLKTMNVSNINIENRWDIVCSSIGNGEPFEVLYANWSNLCQSTSHKKLVGVDIHSQELCKPMDKNKTTNVILPDWNEVLPPADQNESYVEKNQKKKVGIMYPRWIWHCENKTTKKFMGTIYCNWSLPCENIKKKKPMGTVYCYWKTLCVQEKGFRKEHSIYNNTDFFCYGLNPLQIKEQNETQIAIQSSTVTATITTKRTNTSTYASTYDYIDCLPSTQLCESIECTAEGNDKSKQSTPNKGARINGGTIMKGLMLNIVVWMRDQVPGQATQDIDEDELLALIVKDDYKNTPQCKDKLKAYCDELKKDPLKPENVHGKLKDLCKDGNQETKCTELKDKVQQKCTKFQQELKTTLQNLKDEQCAKNERQCLFLEGADPDNLKKHCNQLRETCYQRKRDGVAEEVLLRALSGSLKTSDPQNTETCKKKLPEVCKELGDKSNELAIRCSDSQKTCTSLKKTIEEKCKALKSAVEKAPSPTNEECQLLLEKCHFYGSNCEDADKSKCDDLKKKCEEKNIMFVPPDHPFNPIKPPTTLAEQIGLAALYQKAAQDGVHIGSASTLDVLNLLALLTPTGTGTGIKDACEKKLNKDCSSLKTEYPMLKDLCEDNGQASQEGNNACNALKTRLDSLPQEIENKLKQPGADKNAIPWHKLSDFLIEEDCTELESLCSYFLPHKKSSLGTPCANVRVACYKRGLGAVANDALEERLRGMFLILLLFNKEIDLIKPEINIRGNGNSFIKKHPVLEDSVYKKEYFLAIILEADGLQKDVCKNRLLEYCKKLKDIDSTLSNVEEKIKEICKDIDASCNDFKNITVECNNFNISFQTHFQNKQVTGITNESCESYQQKCLLLNNVCFNDSTVDLTEFCAKIMNFCYQKKLDSIAEKIVLRALKGSLASQDNCTEKLKERCPILSRQSNELMLKCLDPEATCKLFVNNTNETCKDLKKGVQEASRNNNLSIELCNELLEECYFYDSTCNEVKGECESFKEKCNKNNITYTPPGPPFNPIEYPALWLEKIGLQVVYTKAEKQGILITGPRDNYDYGPMLLLAIGESLSLRAESDICEENVTKRCPYIGQLANRTTICQNNNISMLGKVMCGGLNTLRRSEILKTLLTLNGLSNSTIKEYTYSSSFYHWSMLPLLTQEECNKFKWDCLYLKKHKTFLENACINVNVACYKKGIYRSASMLLEKFLYGLLHDTEKEPEKCRKKLFEICVIHRHYNIHIFILCLKLDETCKMLKDDIYKQSFSLQNILSYHGHFPTKEDCFKLILQCNDLIQDSPWLEYPCHILKKRCIHLEDAETLKYNLLEDKTDTLMNVNN
ncbi:hypothetical protein PORY_001597, partial [Pneumocystis oryctolagi]